MLNACGLLGLQGSVSIECHKSPVYVDTPCEEEQPVEGT